MRYRTIRRVKEQKNRKRKSHTQHEAAADLKFVVNVRYLGVAPF